MLKCCCLYYLLYFVIYEIRSAIKQSVREYVKDYWNFIDFLLISTYSIASYLSVLRGPSSTLLILNCLLLILTFMKVNFFLRIYDGFSFLVSMLQGVFQDLKYFMGFFLFVLIEFGLLFFLILA